MNACVPRLCNASDAWRWEGYSLQNPFWQVSVLPEFYYWYTETQKKSLHTVYMRQHTWTKNVIFSILSKPRFNIIFVPWIGLLSQKLVDRYWWLAFPLTLRRVSHWTRGEREGTLKKESCFWKWEILMLLFPRVLWSGGEGRSLHGGMFGYGSMEFLVS